MAATVTVLFISYLLGSIPSAIWVGKGFKGIDVREHGSGNAGTTNTFRVLGVPFGVSVFVLDFMKGFVSSFWISGLAFLWFSGPLAPPNWDVEAFLGISCGMAAVFGHMFPVFAGFKGEKGAATACGMLSALSQFPLVFRLHFLVLLCGPLGMFHWPPSLPPPFIRSPYSLCVMGWIGMWTVAL